MLVSAAMFIAPMLVVSTAAEIRRQFIGTTAPPELGPHLRLCSVVLLILVEARNWTWTGRINN